LVLNAIRFIKRLSNLPNLPGQDKYNLGGELFSKLLNGRKIDCWFLTELVSCFKYGLEIKCPDIIEESTMALWFITQHGKMALR